MPDPKPPKLPDPESPVPMTVDYIEKLNVAGDIKAKAIEMAQNDNYPK